MSGLVETVPFNLRFSFDVSFRAFFLCWCGFLRQRGVREAVNSREGGGMQKKHDQSAGDT